MLPDSCTIHKRTSERTAGGGTRDTYEPEAQQRSCRIAPIGSGGAGSPRAGGARIDESTTHIVTLALPAPEVDHKDRIDVEGVGMFEVTAIRERGKLEFTRRVEVLEL
jgi:hypothetical protein